MLYRRKFHVCYCNADQKPTADEFIHFMVELAIVIFLNGNSGKLAYQLCIYIHVDLSCFPPHFKKLLFAGYSSQWRYA